MNNNPHISIVSPVYRGEKMVAELVRRNVESVTTITDDYEIILVNDASPDNSWNEIVKQCAQNPKVKGINLSRNFGQHYAITAGLHYAKGDWVVVMDCDLQDRPEEIPNLYGKAMEGYDSVFAQRMDRRDGLLKRWSSLAFYRCFSYLTDTKQDSSVANFGIYHRKVIDSVLLMGDKFRYFPTQVQWVGYNKTYLLVDHSRRMEGNSSYSVNKLFRLAFDTITTFSDKPLRLMAKLGLILTMLSTIIGLVYLIKYLTGGIILAGYTSLIISLWFIGGVLIMLLGIVGSYLGKVFEQAKGRPFYLIKNTINI